MRTIVFFILTVLFISPLYTWGQAPDINRCVSLLKDNSSSQALKRQEAFTLIEKQDTAAIIRTADEIQKAMAGGSKRTQLIGKATRARLLFYFKRPYDSVYAAQIKECLLGASKMDEPYLEAEYSCCYSKMLNDLKNKPLAVQYGISSLLKQERLGIKHFSGVATFYINVGEMLFFTRNERDAANYLLKGLGLSARDSVPYFQKIFAYNNLGLSYKNLKIFDSGLYYFQKCMDFSRANNRPDWVATASDNRYDCYIGLAQYDSADAIGNRLLKDGADNNDEFQQMAGNWMTGHSFFMQGQYNKALPLLLKCKELVEKLGIKLLYRVNRDIADCYEGLGQPDKAYPYLKTYKRINDSMERVKTQNSSKYLLTKAMYEEEQDKLRTLETKRKKQINIRNISIAAVTALAAMALLWLNKKRRNARLMQQQAESQLMNFKEDIIQKNDKIETLLAEIHEKQDKQLHSEQVTELSQQMILTEDDWLHFKSLFEKSHPGFFSTLRQKATGITEAEMRMAALIKIQLNTRQMAAMQGISAESIHKNRQRLRQRLALNSTEEMETLLHSI